MAATLLKVLLMERHLQRYESFCASYGKAAEAMGEPGLRHSAPSRAQYYRWLNGQLKGSTPYPDTCRVLQQMFPEWTVAELFAAPPVGLARVPESPPDRSPMADVVAVFASRAEFAAAMPPAGLFDGAREICAAGLSLNILCQQYGDDRLCSLVEAGTNVRALFLDPAGTAVRAREAEEHHPAGNLAALTDLNIRMLTQRARPRLSADARARLQVAVYDETIRFNILLVDQRLGIVQPYLPHARGIDSPTLVLEARDNGGLLPTFTALFESMWGSAQPR